MRCDYSFFGRTKYEDSRKILEYHDFRWCKPIHDDSKMFAMLALEIFQAGLSWEIILNKEDAFFKAFCDFDVAKVSEFNDVDVECLLNDKNIVRNRRKISAVIKNAGKFLRIKDEFGSFDKYIWNFTNNEVIYHKIYCREDIPVKNELSQEISSDLVKRGFSFVGPVIIYSYLQSIGIVNDHHVDCEFRF